MKTIFLCAAFLVFSQAAFGASQDENKVPLLVTTQWLAERLNDPKIVVLQLAANRREYTKGHIPGARFVWIQSFAPSNPDASSELPTVEQTISLFEDLGIFDTSHIVICGMSNRPTSATRLFFTLEYFGFGTRTSILDGGLDVWKAEDRALSTTPTTPKKGHVTLSPKEEYLVGGQWLYKHLNDASVKIIDARDKRFYDGADVGQARSGRIPKAVNIPYTTCFDSTNRFKDKATLAQIFTNAGASQGKRVVTYCHVGQQATVAYFVARLLGYEASVYDGSFEEWGGIESYPIESPPATKEAK